MIDHVKSIQILGCAYWKKARNKNLQVGDICYLYLISKGHYKYAFVLKWLIFVVFVKTVLVGLLHSRQITIVIKLIPTAAMYMGDALSLDTLEEIGINRHSQFKELNECQEDYLRKYFE